MTHTSKHRLLFQKMAGQYLIIIAKELPATWIPQRLKNLSPASEEAKNKNNKKIKLKVISVICCYFPSPTAGTTTMKIFGVI